MTPRYYHTLTITESEHHTADDPHWEWDIACSTPDQCTGWTECLESHEGFDPDDPDSVAYDQTEDVTIHGVAHTWQWGFGWTVPYEGCVVADSDVGGEVRDIATRHGAGVYRVLDEWDEDFCYLDVMKVVTA